MYVITLIFKYALKIKALEKPKWQFGHNRNINEMLVTNSPQRYTRINIIQLHVVKNRQFSMRENVKRHEHLNSRQWYIPTELTYPTETKSGPADGV